MRLFLGTSALCLLVGLTAPYPALADWTADDVTVSGSYSGNSGSAGGAQPYTGNTVSGVSGSIFPDTNGTLTSGGATWTVSRVYTKSGSPADLPIQLSLAVSVEADATGFFTDTAYGDARSKASGSLDFWPDLRQLDKEVNADFPPGENPSDSDNTNNDIGRVYTTDDTVTVSASLYVLTTAWANGGGLVGAGAWADNSVSFSDP